MSTIFTPTDLAENYRAYGYASDKPAKKTLTALTILAVVAFLTTAALLAYIAYHVYTPYTFTADPDQPFNAEAIGDLVRQRNLAIITVGIFTFALAMGLTWAIVSVSERAPGSERYGRAFGWIATGIGAALLLCGVTFFNASVENAADSRYHAQVDAMQTWAQDRYGLDLHEHQAYGMTTINPIDGEPVTVQDHDSATVVVQNKPTPDGIILVDSATGEELPVLH